MMIQMRIINLNLNFSNFVYFQNKFFLTNFLGGEKSEYTAEEKLNPYQDQEDDSDEALS